MRIYKSSWVPRLLGENGDFGRGNEKETRQIVAGNEELFERFYFHGNRGCVMEELEVTLNTDFTQCNFCRWFNIE